MLDSGIIKTFDQGTFVRSVKLNRSLPGGDVDEIFSVIKYVCAKTLTGVQLYPMLYLLEYIKLNNIL